MRLGEFWNISNVINVPNADGSIEEYRVLDAQILHPDLAKQLPNIKSYVGTSVLHPGKYIRFSLSQAGFHGQVLRRESQLTIDPYTSLYILLIRDDLINNSADVFSCD
jgi:hypothetical protein